MQVLKSTFLCHLRIMEDLSPVNHKRWVCLKLQTLSTRFSCLNHLNLTVFNNLVHFYMYLYIFQQHCCHPQKITYYYLQQGIKIRLAIITKLLASLGFFLAVNVHSSWLQPKPGNHVFLPLPEGDPAPGAQLLHRQELQMFQGVTWFPPVSVEMEMEICVF